VLTNDLLDAAHGFLLKPDNHTIRDNVCRSVCANLITLNEVHVFYVTESLTGGVGVSDGVGADGFNIRTKGHREKTTAEKDTRLFLRH